MSEGVDPALIGRRVAGKFVVEQFLGGGAMGAVYRARDDSLDRKVALKVMHPAVAIDPSFVSRFHREAKAASRLDHPNSMRVIEFGEEPDGLLYMAMEYLEGRDLYKVIHEDWPLSDARITDIMMKALSAIAVAHDMGVIHRDLKPENIMILSRKDDEGRDMVKVCDFGIAKIMERDETSPDATPKTAGAKLTTAGVVVGTPEYMSPEQARGERLDSRSDLYSMGIILYQLLTGRTPFLADTALAVVLKHITEAPDPPHVIYPGVHKGLEAVAMRALAKAKEERFQSARDMRAALKAAIDSEDVTDGRSMPTDAKVEMAEAEPRTAAVQSTPPQTAISSAPPPAALAESQPPAATRGTTSTEERKRSKTPLVVVLVVLLAAGGAFAFYAQRQGMLPEVGPAPSTTESSKKLDPKSPSEASSATPAPTPTRAHDPKPLPKQAPAHGSKANSESKSAPSSVSGTHSAHSQ